MAKLNHEKVNRMSRVTPAPWTVEDKRRGKKKRKASKFPAKYKGVCVLCGEDISVGQTIQLILPGKAKHSKCKKRQEPVTAKEVT